jgi:nucleotide-binding universal stress UspA family protein
VIELSRILCAVDFSRPARTAFARALALSRQHNAELTVVQAVPVTEPFGLRGRARMAHIATLRQVAEAEGVTLRVSVQHGDPAGVIMLHANARPFDLAVVGTHQRIGMGRLREGSVARIKGSSDCPRSRRSTRRPQWPLEPRPCASILVRCAVCSQ